MVRKRAAISTNDASRLDDRKSRARCSLGVAWFTCLIVLITGLAIFTFLSYDQSIEGGGTASFPGPPSTLDTQAMMRDWKTEVHRVDTALSKLRRSGDLQTAATKAKQQSSEMVGASSGLRSLLRQGHQARVPPPPDYGPRIMPSPQASSGQQSDCRFEEDVDYPATGGEDVIEDTTAEACCRICVARNTNDPGSCDVAVLSSRFDTPPSACWIKVHVMSSVGKPGVKACWPPNGLRRPDARRGVEHQQLLPLQHPAALPSLVPGQVADEATLRKRAEAIRDAMRHAWSSYRKLAWGFDDLKPISGRGSNGHFQHAVTMVDSLDTLWIMGMRAEFDDARNWIAQHLPSKLGRLSASASVFETTIRTLGGLLSAYDLSKDELFLDLSKQLGARIIATANGRGVFPYTFGGGTGGMNCPSLAESGTNQVEFAYLAHVTGDDSFWKRSERFYTTIKRKNSLDGLWPNCWESGRGKITFGADGDSFYEYLLKVWLLKGGDIGGPDYLWEMFEAAADGLERHLVRQGPESLTYLGNVMWQGQPGGNQPYQEEMEHLTCFAPGWLALGAKAGRSSAEASERRLSLAQRLARTCWAMYEQQPSGIGPERVKNMKMDLSSTDTREYILRPEAMEAWFYMRELTDDPLYREWGWRAFQSFETHLKVPHGYASLADVRRPQGKKFDRMESFFLAETLKYAFLLQDPDHTIKLDKYVFNTEAHPLSVIK
eukprot:TRINITY_DN23514_c0_g2_i1.p1 TRINITY_DN23514_c0_g2~~TRINITY_DN23514_c0_g2_i1.p1  ORF type:complete len:718 (-),score=93.84 TRINITY_DN23514_c0_g2_i1:418-2571(-)